MKCNYLVSYHFQSKDKAKKGFGNHNIKTNGEIKTAKQLTDFIEKDIKKERIYDGNVVIISITKLPI